MENLEKDPIIEFYLNFTESTVQESSLPLFSETLLRLAARHALGNRPVDTEILTLYRKLILFYYAETYTAVDDLLKIMPCYTEDELINCFDDFETLKNEWMTFTKNHLTYYIRKKAFFAIFTEWTRRYMQLHEELDVLKLRGQAVKIHEFFNWSTKGINKWQRSFEANTLKGNWAQSTTGVKLGNITEKDLSIEKIATDIKDQFHPLINKELQEILTANDDSSDNESEISENASSTTASPNAAKRRRTMVASPKVKDDSHQQTTSNIQEEFRDLIEDDCDGDIVQVLEVSDTESDAIDDGTSTEIEEETSIIKIEETTADEETSIVNNEDVAAEKESPIINNEKATSYLSALQAYMVVNGLYDAIPLLDRVDSILRAKLEIKKEPEP